MGTHPDVREPPAVVLPRDHAGDRRAHPRSGVAPASGHGAGDLRLRPRAARAVRLRDRRAIHAVKQMPKGAALRESLVALVALTARSSSRPHPARRAPEGQMTWAVHVSLAPTWFDPAETPGIGTPFMILYALARRAREADAGQRAWRRAWPSRGPVEGRPRLRVRAAPGRPVPQRRPGHRRRREVLVRALPGRRGASSSRSRVAAVEVVDAGPGPLPAQGAVARLHDLLREAWPPAPAGSCPGSIVEKVGDDGFKKAPVGAGPYRFVSFNPGVELVLEANEQLLAEGPEREAAGLQRRCPTRPRGLAMLKRGEADIVYLASQARSAEEVQRTPGLTLRPTPIVSTHWLVFARSVGSEVAVGATGGSGWPPTTPIDRQAINQAITLGFSTNHLEHHPQSFDFYWQPPAYRLRSGQGAGSSSPRPATRTASTPVTSGATPPPAHHERGRAQLSAGGRGSGRKVQSARAGRHSSRAYQEKKLKNIVYGLSGVVRQRAPPASGDHSWPSGGPYVYGSYPDIDGLFQEQAGELDRKRARGDPASRSSSSMHDKAMYAPIWELGFIHAQGPGVAESGLGLIADYPWSAPYERREGEEPGDAARTPPLLVVRGPPDAFLHPPRRHQARSTASSFTLHAGGDAGPRRRVGIRQIGNVPLAGPAGPRSRRDGSSAAASCSTGEDLLARRAPAEMRRVRGKQIAMVLRIP